MKDALSIIEPEITKLILLREMVRTCNLAEMSSFSNEPSNAPAMGLYHILDDVIAAYRKAVAKAGNDDNEISS